MTGSNTMASSEDSRSAVLDVSSLSGSSSSSSSSSSATHSSPELFGSKRGKKLSPSQKEKKRERQQRKVDQSESSVPWINKQEAVLAFVGFLMTTGLAFLGVKLGSSELNKFNDFLGKYPENDFTGDYLVRGIAGESLGALIFVIVETILESAACLVYQTYETYSASAKPIDNLSGSSLPSIAERDEEETKKEKVTNDTNETPLLLVNGAVEGRWARFKNAAKKSWNGSQLFGSRFYSDPHMTAYAGGKNFASLVLAVAIPLHLFRYGTADQDWVDNRTADLLLKVLANSGMLVVGFNFFRRALPAAASSLWTKVKGVKCGFARSSSAKPSETGFAAQASGSEVSGFGQSAIVELSAGISLVAPDPDEEEGMSLPNTDSLGHAAGGSKEDDTTEDCLTCLFGARK